MPPTMRGATKALAIQKKVNNISIYNTKYFVWKASSSYKMTQAQLSSDIDEVYLNVQHFLSRKKFPEAENQVFQVIFMF